MQPQLKTLGAFAFAPSKHRSEQYVTAPVFPECVTPIYNTTLHWSFILFFIFNRLDMKGALQETPTPVMGR
jgi:hypothetical protein